MSAQDNGGPAFPVDEISQYDNSVCAQHFGVTVRDYFAAHAPEPPNDFAWKDGETDVVQRLVRWRFAYADAMLKARQL